jgi:6-phosphogluconolactonase/glucosamine-6-phosphate isomerase/deaminase
MRQTTWTGGARRRSVSDGDAVSHDAVLGLPAGPLLPIAACRRAPSACVAEGLVDIFPRASVFAVDEFVGISPFRIPPAFVSFWSGISLSGLNVTPERIHSMDGKTAPDPRARKCRRYEGRDPGGQDGITLQILGIGANGHIGFKTSPADTWSARNAPGGASNPGHAVTTPTFFVGDISRVPRLTP